MLDLVNPLVPVGLTTRDGTENRVWDPLKRNRFTVQNLLAENDLSVSAGFK